MKVNVSTINKIIWGPLLIGCGVTGYCAIKDINSAIEKENAAKEIIKQKNEDKYNQLLKKEDKSMFSVNWYEEASKLQDSLKMDSIAKTNYALGMQAIRDSIAKKDLSTPQELTPHRSYESISSKKLR